MKATAKRAIAASVLALVTATAGMPAMADPGDPYKVGGASQENTANKALINPTATVQLDIHKYLGQPTGAPNNGTEITAPALPKLQNVNFDVYVVNGVDLTTNEGWQAASAIHGYTPTAADIAAGTFTIGGKAYTITKSQTVTTNASGTAVFTKPNGVGLYLVAENLTSSSNILKDGAPIDKNTITAAKPFFVTLPMTNPNDTTRWMYDVNVYPKNQADSITKEVKDGNTGTTNQDSYYIGQKLTYVLTSTVTVADYNQDKVIDGTDLGYYYVEDKLASQVGFDSATLKVLSATGVATPLVETTDYVRTVDTATNTVKISFTSAGLNKLAANGGGKVVTEIVAVVKAMPGNGQLPNAAGFIPSGPWLAGQGKAVPKPGTPPPTDVPEIPSNEVVSKFGNIVITKFDPAAERTAENAKKMAGAVFTIYRDTNADQKCTADEVSGAGFATATVGQDGTATFTGVEASNWYNNSNQTVIHGYCIVETMAPVGYNLDAQPKHVWVDWNKGTQTVPAIATMEVANEKSNIGNSLPLTGGAGVAALSIAGVVLVGGGVAYYVVANRRRKDA